MTAEEDSIEQAAADRRERLKALREAKELFNAKDGDADTTADGDDEPKDDENQSLKFRNYLPHDEKLQEGKLAPPVLPKFEDPIAAAPPVEKIEDPFVNIAPKKPNWDLRRDIQKKLDKLERRTQKAIAQLAEEQAKANQELAEENGEAASGED
ncbi:hypothetical protein MKW94_013888 [Papaver nudicaule]|uniref:Coiled-coil domain-containing protein 12 n=1 Tax=Papaver nudicaule TaxID=74823 RepID=A0AA41V105_PAPNU|nr:hypothetical protein [Papaver nudicaule]